MNRDAVMKDLVKSEENHKQETIDWESKKQDEMHQGENEVILKDLDKRHKTRLANISQKDYITKQIDTNKENKLFKKLLIQGK